MSHVDGRSSTDKEKIFNKQLKSTDKNCRCLKLLFNRSTADCKCSNHNSKTDGQRRIKRLKSRKERSQMRGGGKEAPKSKSHHNHCQRQSSKDIPYVHDRCSHRSCYCPSRRDAPFLNVVPAAQEPSIITDSRLIGHHGLFNHEVKSIDIERLLSKQRKMEKIGQQVHKNIKTSRPTSTSHAPSPISSNEMLGADEVMPLEKKADHAMKAHEDFQEKENKISQGSDVTPGQKTNPVISEESRACPLTPTDGRENLTKLNKKVKRYKISTLEHTPKNQGSPARQTQALFFSPSPPHLSSSHAADNLDLQLKPDPNCVSESVCAVAARLPECLQFPLVRKKNLVAESREVLLKALRERHGPRLQENLFKLQRCLSFGSDPTKEVQDQEPTVIEEDELQCTDALSTEFHSSEPFFDDPRTKSFKRKGSVYFHWKSSPQLLQNLTQPAEWFKRPEETSASLLDDILRPPCSPQFCMDFEPSGISDHLFAPSPTSCRGERASTSPHWGDTSKRPKSKETFMFNSFEHGLMNHTRALGGPQYGNSSTQPLFPHRAQLPETHSTEPMHFPRKQDPLETKRHSFAPSFSSQILGPEQSHSFQPFSQFSHPSACPPLRSHHTDMSHYPPSHMLERDPAPSRSSLLSPEHWSFPPMRLF